MGKAVLSPEWMQDYIRLWNANPATREGTASLSMLIEYRLADGEQRAGQFEVVKGEAVSAGPSAENRKPDYRLTATLEDWKRLADGELAPDRAINGRVLRLRAPMRTVMAHMEALGAAIAMVGEVEETDWVA